MRFRLLLRGPGRRPLRNTAGIVIFAGLVVSMQAQTPNQVRSGDSARLEFEVASVKPADLPPLGTPIAGTMSGGPGTNDPGRIAYERVSLQRVFTVAYSVGKDQIIGPRWIDSDRFTIVAKIPMGATQEQVKVMLQNLLMGRFRLALHHETKDFLVYQLTIAKNGPKLKRSIDDRDAGSAPSAAPASSPSPALNGGSASSAATDKNGFLQLPSGKRASGGSMTNGEARMTFRDYTISDLVGYLSLQLGTVRITDKTELTGKYDFTLFHSTEGTIFGRGGTLAPSPTPTDQGTTPIAGDSGGGPTLPVALEKQLGLKLETTTTPLDVIVIDHVIKVPTEN